MKNKTIIGVVLIIVLALGVYFFLKPTEEPSIQAYFTSISGESIKITFHPDNQTAVLDGKGYEGLILTQAVSGSGARYVNEAEGLELWNKGSDITLSKNQSVLFQGRTWTNENGDPIPPPSDLYVFAGPTWVWDRTELNDGSIVRPAKAGEYSIRFEAEGKIQGDTDCNNFSGTYSAGTGNTLSFGPFMMTKMYCEGSQETEFAKMVADSTQYTFTPAGELVLMIKFDSGSVIFKKK